MATLEHLEPVRPVNYICIITISSDLLRVFFYGKTFSIRYSTAIKSSPLTISIQEIRLGLRTLVRRLEAMISFVPAIGRKFIQSRHPGRYLRTAAITNPG